MKEAYHYDEMQDTLTIHRVEDVGAVLDANKRQFDPDNKHYKENFNHVARIPLIVLEKYCKDKGIKYEEFINSEKLFKRFLNDPDNKFFRTKPGRI